MDRKSMFLPLYMFFLTLLSACTAAESPSPDSPGQNLEIEVARMLQDKKLTASPADVYEDRLNSLWVAFYNKASGLRVGQSYRFSGNDIQGNKVRIENYDPSLLNQPVDVVVVANPDGSLTKRLKSCGRRNELNNLKTAAYTAAFPTYACMLGTVPHTFTKKNPKATVNLIRLPAKVEISCDKQHVAGISKIVSYIWENIPLASYLIQKTTGNQDIERGTVSTDALSGEKGLGYPYEYARGMERGKVKIRAQKNNGDVCYYYFLLPEEIKRNHWYKFGLTLTGEGGTEERPEEVPVILEVVPWTDKDNSVNIGDVYLECPREMSLYVRTQGTVVNPERSFVFHTNVGIADCKVEPAGDLLYCDINPVPGGGRIHFQTKEDVFYEFHPRVKTSITLTAGNISRKVDITLIPLLEIHPRRPNVIMVWPGHEFYYNSAKHGGLYVHTPFTPEGYADNQQKDPNMCQMIEVYNQDYEHPLQGRYAWRNYDAGWINGRYAEYKEDFCGYWNTLNGCQRHSDVRTNKSCAEELGNGWRCPTEYELRAMYQAWAYFGRPVNEGGSDIPPEGYRTQEEKDLYKNTRNFYKRFYYNNDEARPYGCATYKSDYGGVTVAQYFRYNWDGSTYTANPFLNDYNTDKTVLIRPVRDYCGSVTVYEKDTWIDRTEEAGNDRI